MNTILLMVISFVLGGLMFPWVLKQLDKFFAKND